MMRTLSVKVEQRYFGGSRVPEQRRGLRLGKRWGQKDI